jgi:DNA polymerase-1
LNPAFRNLTNGRYTPAGKGLLGALRYYGLDTIATTQKDAMQKRVMAGWPFTAEEQERILDYCASDVDALRRLLPKILSDPDFDLGVALYHGEFATASALMEHRGVPIDLPNFQQLADKKTWAAVRDAMVPVIDAKYGVYVRDAAGDWTFNMKRFAAYLEREGIVWPLLETGNFNMKRKTFEDMSKGFLNWRNYVSSAMRATKCARLNSPLAAMPGIAAYCGRSRPRLRAPSLKRRNGFFLRQCGCGP